MTAIEKPTLGVKITVQEFLKRYRSAGMPNAKKARRLTRLAQAEQDKKHFSEALLVASERIVNYKKALAVFADEYNWAVKEGTDLVWVGDVENPAQLAQDTLSNTRKNQTYEKRPDSTPDVAELPATLSN